MFAAHQLTADYKRAFSASRPIAVCEHDLLAMKFKKLFALSLFAVLFESALVLGGYVGNGQCEVTHYIMF